MSERDTPNEGTESAHEQWNEADLTAEPPHPINWNLLTSHDLEQELLELNRWVNWLRLEYGLPASVIPPLWLGTPSCSGSCLRSIYTGSAPMTRTKTALPHWAGIETSLTRGSVCAIGCPQAAPVWIETGPHG